MKTATQPKNDFLFNSIAAIAKQATRDVIAKQNLFQDKYDELVKESNHAFSFYTMSGDRFYHGKAEGYSLARNTVAMLALMFGSYVIVTDTDYSKHITNQLSKQSFLSDSPDHYGSKADAADVVEETEEED